MQNWHVWRRWWRFKRYLSSAVLPAHEVECPCCAARVALPSLGQGATAACPECGHHLFAIQTNPFIAPLAFVGAAWILMLLVANQFYLGMSMPGVSEQLTVVDVFSNLRRHEYGFLATVMLLLVFFTPVLFMSLFMYVYIALYRQRHWRFLNVCARSMIRLKPWLMVDVFFVATLVAMVKIAAISTVSLGVAFVFIFAYAVLLIQMGQMTDPHWLFYQLAKLDPEHDVFGQHHRYRAHGISCTRCLYAQNPALRSCQVCGTALHRRRPFSLQYAAAFLLTAVILYIPSNLFVMMNTDSLGSNLGSNIYDGVVELWQSQDYPVAIIVFVASLLIPCLKILLLSVLLYSARFRLLLPPRLLSKLHRFIEFIGRWSMIDIFVIIILMAVFRTNLASVTPGAASVYFTLVIFTTMLSAQFLDIRLIWDKQRQSPEPALYLNKTPPAHRSPQP